MRRDATLFSLAVVLVLATGAAGQQPQTASQQSPAPDASASSIQTTGKQKKKPAEPKTDAERYAAELEKFVNSVVGQIGARMKIERTYYDNTSASYAANFRRNVLDGLASARNERASEIADSISSGSTALARSDIEKSLREGVNTEIDALRQSSRSEQELKAAYLGSLASAGSTADQFKPLLEALDKLATPKSSWESLKELVQYGQDVNSAYEKLACDDLKKQVDEVTKQDDAAKKDLTAAKAAEASSDDKQKADALVKADTAKAASLDAQLKQLKDKQSKCK